MLKTTHRAATGFVLAGTVLLSGCGSGSNGAKPTAQVRAVDVATNVVNTFTNTDTAVVTVNGGAADNLVVPYGTPTRYLFVQSGTSAFAGSTTMTIPTITVPSTTTAGQIQTTAITPPAVSVSLATNALYTGYLVGRPDVPNPTQPNLSDLDPRFLRVVVCQDDQAAPSAGMATVRVVDGVCDSPETPLGGVPPKVDVYINGSPITALQTLQFDTVTADQSLPTGTVSVEVKEDGTGTVLVPPTNIILTPGSKYTLCVDEPSAQTQTGVTPPKPPQTALTYGVTLVQD